MLSRERVCFEYIRADTTAVHLAEEMLALYVYAAEQTAGFERSFPGDLIAHVMSSIQHYSTIVCSPCAPVVRRQRHEYCGGLHTGTIELS
jgi:hypothetical protein